MTGAKLLTIIICSLLVFTHLCHAAPAPEGIQVYQKNMHLSAEHKQKLAADIYRYQNADDMWDELRHDFILPHHEDNPAVQEQIAWFLNHQDYLIRSATRAAPYLYFILQQVRKRHLPGETVLLPMIESAYNPFAYSPQGAAGIWQMMPGTASGFGIKQNWWYDGRRDVVASTRAALDYLAYLGNFFEGNWLLAIAAYDTGEGNVLSAMRKNNRAGFNTDFWSLPLAQETRIYVPRLLALAAIISHPEQYAVVFPPVHNAPYLAQIDLGTPIDLPNAALRAGLSLQKLKQLNPGYNRTTTDPHRSCKLVLPIEHVQQFTENLARSPHDLKTGKNVALPQEINSISKTILASSKKMDYPIKENESSTAIAAALENFQEDYSLQPGDTLYMVRSGDDFEKISTHFHIPVKILLAVNQLHLSSDLPPGKQLIIPTHLVKDTEPQPTQPIPATNPTYLVQNGDDIDSIAQKFHTTASAIRVANLLTDNNIKTGDELVIPVRLG